MTRLWRAGVVTALTLSSLLPTTLAAKPVARSVPVPVMVGAEAELNACTSIGRAVGPKRARAGLAAVRASPAATAPVIARLAPGFLVWICEQKNGADHYGIVFGAASRSRGADGLPPACGVNAPIAQPKAYRGPCRSGWIRTADIEAIAG